MNPLLFQELSDDTAQAISGGGQLSIYDSVQTIIYQPVTQTEGYTNAGGQLKQNKSGAGWEPVTSTSWVEVSNTQELTLVDKEQVSGKGGSLINSSTVIYLSTDGTVLSGSPL